MEVRSGFSIAIYAWLASERPQARSEAATSRTFYKQLQHQAHGSINVATSIEPCVLSPVAVMRVRQVSDARKPQRGSTTTNWRRANLRVGFDGLGFFPNFGNDAGAGATERPDRWRWVRERLGSMLLRTGRRWAAA